ncbi:glycosyl transferase [Subtercola sp. Z020]|uniref:glycosyltransferase n=1 Tax=Subtercola sp. Z020 TaxID=2080582 RepID=UPI000CE81A1A|nr:glycosyltransferase [Subtercola sp. Z020]PPF87838.1 glycosyl transferase [Subtercola sp. Z020]
MRVLLWHVHGGWAESFVRGPHRYLLPTTAEGGPWGLGRGGRDWPNAVEVAPGDLSAAGVDVVVLQRPDELAEVERLLGRRPGRDIPAVYVEHNTPKGDVPNALHPLAEQSDIPLVHVTHFNDLMWDSGRAPTTVVEHGVPDPGALYTGALVRTAVVINEPVRRWRVTGTDLLPRFAEVGPVDVFGMGTDALPSALAAHAGASPAVADRFRILGDLPPARLHAALAERRVYVHPFRWTSLGLTLLEAMHLGMPVVALAATEATLAVPPEAGAISPDVDALVRATRLLLDDPEEAARRGAAARGFALAHFGLSAFLDRWNGVLAEAVERHSIRSHRRERPTQTPPARAGSPARAFSHEGVAP